MSANPLALAMRALALVPVGGDTAAAELSWRIVRHCDTKEGLPPLTLSSNKHDPAAPQPPHFGPFKGRVGKVLALRPEQQRSLSWMLEQEEEGAAPFIEEEVAEATALPRPDERLEARPCPRHVRGASRRRPSPPSTGGSRRARACLASCAAACSPTRHQRRSSGPHAVSGASLTPRVCEQVGYGKTVITVALIDAAPREPLPPPPPLRRDGCLPPRARLLPRHFPDTS